MNVLDYRVSLDMFDTLSQITIKAKKGDSACKIHISLTKHGKIYNIGEGCYATFAAKKSDGNFIYDRCTIENNTIVYDFLSSVDEKGVCQVSACEGIVECEVTLYKADSEQLTSPRFTLFIDGTVYNGEDIASSSEANALKELINEVNATIDEIETKLENGEFVGEKGDKGDKGEDGTITNLDQTYNPYSENAQSGKAVAEALNRDKILDYITVETSWSQIDNEKIIVIKDCKTNISGSHIIPETIDGFRVEVIDCDTFADCYNLKSIVLPNGIISIREAAFHYCSSLTSITIPSSLSSVAAAAFEGCENLTDVYYGGTQEQWNEAVTVGGNDCLFNATIHYNQSFDAINNVIGNIETALDAIIADQEAIIAIQNALIGGGNV